MLRFYRASIALSLLFCALSFLTTTVSAKYIYTFYSVINQTNESLGDVSIKFADGSSQIVPVGANQTVSILVTQDVSAITINGQTVPARTTTTITLPSGATSEIIVRPNEDTIIR